MKKQIYVEVSIVDQLREFLETAGIDIAVVTDGNYDLAVVQSKDRQESDLDTVYSGGWIACETARGLAKKLQIPVGQMGKLLDHLDVKVRRCGLGCFE